MVAEEEVLLLLLDVDMVEDVEDRAMEVSWFETFLLIAGKFYFFGFKV